MEKRKKIGSGGVTSLPFIRNREKVKKTDIGPSIDNTDGALIRPTFRLREYGLRPVLNRPVSLPERDPRGVPMGNDFECWKRARDSKIGMPGDLYSLKTGRMQATHSMLEGRLQSYFDMCPLVVDFRTQYPSWDRDEYERYFLAGQPFPKVKVMTIDFMLTLSVPGIPDLIYHGISAKPRALINSPKIVARHLREATALSKWGATHEIMDEFTVPDQEYKNYLLLKTWILWTDMDSHKASAFDLAETVKRSKAQGSLDRVVSMLGRRLGFDRDEAYSLLGVAIFFGFLWLDHKYPLSVTEPLMLIK